MARESPIVAAEEEKRETILRPQQLTQAGPLDIQLREREEQEAQKLRPLDGQLQLLEAAEDQEDEAPTPGQDPSALLPELSEEEQKGADEISRELALEEETEKTLFKLRREQTERDLPFVPEGDTIMDVFDRMSPSQKRLTLEIAGTFAPIPGPRIAAGASLLLRIANRVLALTTRSGAPGAIAGSAISETFDPSDDFEEALQKAAIAGGTAVAGQKAGEVITKAGGALLRPAKEKLEKGARVAIEALAKKDEILTPGRAGKSFFVDLVESVADMAVLGGETLGKAREGATSAAETSAKVYFQTFQRQASKTEVGELLQVALDDGKLAFQLLGRRIFGNIDSQTGNTLVNIEAPKLLAKAVLETSEKTIPSGTIRTAANALLKQDDEVSWEVAQTLRSELLAITRQPTELVAGKAERAVSELAASVDKVMAIATEGLGGDALQSWRFANAYWQGGKTLFNSSLFKTIAKRDPEAVFEVVVKNGKPATIKKVRELFEFEKFLRDGEIVKVPRPAFKKEWGEIQGQFLDDILKKSATSGEIIQSVEFGTLAPVDGSKLIQQFNKLGEDSLKELFPDATVRQRFIELTRTLRLTQKRTEKGMLQMAVMLGQGAALGTVLTVAGFTGDPKAIGGAFALLLTPRLLAKILVSKTGNKWLTTGLTAPPGSKASVEAITKLAAFLGRPDLVGTEAQASTLFDTSRARAPELVQ